jgi:folate-binding protein YgfZ
MVVTPQFLSQHAALTTGVGFADLSDRTRLEVRGTDRVSFLHAFCTNDIKRLAVGEGCEAFITSPQGKTLGHVLVFCEPDRLLLNTSPSQAPALTSHFNKYVISEDVEFVDRTLQTGELLLAGAKAPEALHKLLGGRQASGPKVGSPGPGEPELTIDHPPESHITPDRPPDQMLSGAAAVVAGCSLSIRRVEYAGPLSYFLQAATADLPKLTDALMAAGAIACEKEAVEAARLEAGFPLYGQDITSENLPQEVGRDAKAISFTKGCYLGQETVARIDALGHVNRLLVGVRCSGTTISKAGTPLSAGEKEVGRVTSAAWSPRLHAPLALAWVRRTQSAPRTTLAIADATAEIISLPIA